MKGSGELHESIQLTCVHCFFFSPRPRDLPEESRKDETRREDEALVSRYCCNLH